LKTGFSIKKHTATFDFLQTHYRDSSG
jgi:hypothetical protein